MGEVADVHRELFLEHAESYGENVRTKVERCLALSDAEYAPRQPSESATASGFSRLRRRSTWCSRRRSSVSLRLFPPTSSRFAIG